MRNMPRADYIIDFVFRNRLRAIPINITVLDWLICPRILFANIHVILPLQAFAQSYFLAHCFSTERDLACIFATLSPRWDY